ncbi:MAG TPA: RNA-binding protein [Gammaproteobacteria bacterium]|nr:RNA-binding protein [Gammaproteobacteria bacterium]
MLSIFVGNLAFKVRGRQLAELFEPYGAIESIRIVKDRNTGRGKGFGFVDMKAVAARKAIAELDGTEFFGRILKVGEANAQKNE